MQGDGGPHGWLVVDKPSGLTSSRVVDAVRHHFGGKAGHAGTLDPLATGVLPIALGEATKTAGYAMAGRKRYRFRIRWGVARTTDDALEELRRCSGTQFDPRIVAVLVAVVRERVEAA